MRDYFLIDLAGRSVIDFSFERINERVIVEV